MKTRLIRGTLNSYADDNPELGRNSECRDFIPGVLQIRQRESPDYKQINLVVKTIVVRNLFSFEYEGSNPSLPTNLYK